MFHDQFVQVSMKVLCAEQYRQYSTVQYKYCTFVHVPFRIVKRERHNTFLCEEIETAMIKHLDAGTNQRGIPGGGEGGFIQLEHNAVFHLPISLALRSQLQLKNARRENLACAASVFASDQKQVHFWFLLGRAVFT